MFFCQIAAVREISCNFELYKRNFYDKIKYILLKKEGMDMARSEAREVAFCLLFERSFSSHTNPEDYANLFDEVALTSEDVEYIKSVLEAYENNREIIDTEIKAHSRNWKLSRMPRADLSVMRLAVCEMMYSRDVPAKVAVNEAINLAKVYCADESPSFINGVLNGCLKEL